MPDILNEAQLINLMEQKVSEALELVAEDVLQKFKKDYLRKYVYASGESHKKNVRYHDDTGTPTFQFEESWRWSAMKKQVMTLSKEMFYDPVNMGFDPSTFLHGSRYSSPPDIRDNLPAILEGKQSSLWLSVPRKYKFWQKFIEDMFNGGELGKIIEYRFSQKGFVRI